MVLRKYFPDFLTAMNLVCGLIALVFAFDGRPDLAFYMMLAAAVFDFCDGFAARALDAYSDLGKELDSLCDLVSFGVLPAVMLRLQMQAAGTAGWLCWIPLLLAVFSALRLAKFNVDDRQKASFIGLPTPACAMLCAAFCHYVHANPSGVLASWASGPVLIPLVSLCLSFLLVCELPMFSMKFHADDSPALKRRRLAFLVLAALSVAACLVFGLTWSFAVMLVFVVYILLNSIFAKFRV